MTTKFCEQLKGIIFQDVDETQCQVNKLDKIMRSLTSEVGHTPKIHSMLSNIDKYC